MLLKSSCYGITTLAVNVNTFDLFIVEISQYKSSGAFLCQKFAAKTKFLDHRFAYRFPKLEDHEIEKFASFDLNPVEVLCF